MNLIDKMASHLLREQGFNNGTLLNAVFSGETFLARGKPHQVLELKPTGYVWSNDVAWKRDRQPFMEIYFKK